MYVLTLQQQPRRLTGQTGLLFYSPVFHYIQQHNSKIYSVRLYPGLIVLGETSSGVATFYALRATYQQEI